MNDNRPSPPVQSAAVAEGAAAGQSTSKPADTHPATEAHQPAATGERVLAGRYKLLEKLGAGAMGTVYKAQDLKLGRTVAIKILPERSTPDPEAVARFQREARALAKLSHVAIVQAYDEDEDAGRHFLVMEFVAGRNLATVVQDNGGLPPTRAADYAHQVALGLAHAHERGLVHRDLKPGNILLVPDGTVKILDLGLARFLQDQIGDATLTLEGSGIGTPDYMAPEQFTRAKSVDPRADIYSLGCTLFHLIAGRVPFPTSSLTEKFAAHEGLTPPPLEELCPEMPAGLALAVGRMMAKRPEDRFQTAAEAAEALAPYVAGSSMSFSGLKATASWHGSQLGIKVASKRRQRRQWMMVAGAGALAAAGIPLGIWQSGIFDGPDNDGSSGSAGGSGGSDPPTAKAPDDPNVLTVAQNGDAEYRTINEALAAATAGKTIRILDDATYNEKLVFSDRQKHAGVTIDAPQRATVQSTGMRAVALSVKGVPDVTVRGLRLKSGGRVQTLVAVDGAAPGLRLDGLDLDAVGADDCEVIMFYGADHADDEPPAIVERCTIRGGRLAISVQGYRAITREVVPCRRVIIRENTIFQPGTGIVGIGALVEVQIVGNRICGPTGQAGIQLQSLAGARQILVANNSILDCSTAFLLWDEQAQGEEVELSGNLILSPSSADMVFVRAGPRDDAPSGAGDTKQLLEKWTFGDNWRELTEPKDTENSPWIPVAKGDVRHDKIEVLSRVPHDADFLRPAADSPLATKGTGGDLPAYVGAVPPPGVAAWDWQETWNSRHSEKVPDDSNVLTVAQDGNGHFTSINAALDQVKQGQTIRILDDAIYEGPFLISSPEIHTGITIESPMESARHPTLQMNAPGVLLRIDGVPRVTIRGMRIRAETRGQTLIGALGAVAGLVLDDLDLDSEKTSDYEGIVLMASTNSSDQPPVIIRKCTISRSKRSITVAGRALDVSIPHLTNRVVVAGNRIIQPSGFGILAAGKLADLQIVGNRVESSTNAPGLQFERLVEPRNILVANNTFFRCRRSIVMNECRVPGDGLAVVGNLVLDSTDGDFVDIDIPIDTNEPRVGDPAALKMHWGFRANWREGAEPVGEGLIAKSWIRPEPDDVRQDRIDVLQRDPTHPDFLRPAADSELATKGAGGDLPTYVGAVPPAGVDAWNWQKTWDSRHPPDAERSEESASRNAN
jgi:serine/threonine protein kinase